MLLPSIASTYLLSERRLQQVQRANPASALRTLFTPLPMTTHIIRVITRKSNDRRTIPLAAWLQLADALRLVFEGKLTIREYDDADVTPGAPRYAIDMELPGDARNDVLNVIDLTESIIDEVVTTYLGADDALAR